MNGPDNHGTLSEAAPQQLHGDAIAAQDVQRLRAKGFL